MKVFTSVIAAAILGFAHQAIAEEKISCYDNGWDFDISDSTAIEGNIYEFCDSLDENSRGVPTTYEFTRSDGSPFSADFTVSGNVMDSETCKSALAQVIWSCPEEASGGDATHFKGGAVTDREAFAVVTIDCQNDFCPKE